MEVLKVTSGTGLCSCLTVRVHDAVAYYDKYEYYPEKIDSSQQFGLYCDFPKQNISKILMNEYTKREDMPYLPFNHGWQYGWYDEIHIEKLSKLALTICPISQAVGNKSYDFIQRMTNRTAVLYRGNDKVKEIPAAPYKAMIEMALVSGSDKFIVQTDEIEFYETFKNVFPDTIRFEELGMINQNFDSYYLPKIGAKADFAINFLAALRAIAHAGKLITITGNTGLWTMIFRGHTKNVWQFNGNYNSWKKLN